MRRRPAVIALALLAPLWAGCEDPPPELIEPAIGAPGKLSAPCTLVVSPYRDRLDQAFSALGAALSERLGAEVKVEVAASYKDAIARLVDGRADLGFLPGLSFIMARRKAPGLRLLVSEEIRASLYDRAVLVVREQSAPKSVPELRGKRFALVSRTSASGYLFPKVCLKRHGLDPDEVLSEDRVVFAGQHDKALALLLKGEVDVAATYDWAVTESSGRLKEGVRVLAWSEPLPHSVMAAGPKMKAADARALRDALLSINRERSEDAALLKALELIGVTGFAHIPEAALEPLRLMEQEAGP